MKIFKNWIRLFFVSFIVSMTSLALFNFFVDSAGVFGNKSYLAKASEELVSGKMIAGLSDYDERVFQELIIRNIKKDVDAIALGSSRAMMIRKKYVVSKDEVFFNHSVSRATLEDYLAVMGMYHKIRGKFPKKVIIGVDPWIFNKFGGQIRWRSVKEYYFDFLSLLKEENIEDSSLSLKKWKQLINYEYTEKNLKSIFGNRASYHVIDDKNGSKDSIRDIDGSIYYPPNHRGSDKAVENLAIKFPLSTNEHSLGRFTEISNRDDFKKFISYLQKNGVKITFVLFPYHPISYDLLIKDKRYAIIKDVELYLKEFAKDNNIEIFGSYNPHKFNFTNRDFMDGMHGLERVTKKILERN